MVDYQYQGVDRSGKKVQGTVTAGTEGELRMQLRSQGIRPTKISKASALNTDLGTLIKTGGTGAGGGTVPLTTLVGFTRQLQVLISSGIPIVQALEVLADQAILKNFKNVLKAITEKVSSGAFFWEALAAYPKIFPRIYVSLIRAGETSGAVDQMLKRLCRYLEDADRLRKTIKGAMMYPIIVVSIGIGVIALMMIFVIPKFEELLKANNQELPLPTQIVISTSHFMINNVYAILGSVVAGVIILSRFFKSQEGKAVLDRALFRAPLFGNIMQKSGVARFARTMSTLLASGVNLMDAIETCRSTINNVVIETAIAKVRGEVEMGKTLGAVIGKITVFPKMASQMIAIGESTGNLDKMLEKVADFYEEEVDAMVSGMTKLMEPLILVFLGGTVGGLMIAMYLPIFKLAGGTD